jgi:hypothetical protein
MVVPLSAVVSLCEARPFFAHIWRYNALSSPWFPTFGTFFTPASLLQLSLMI